MALEKNGKDVIMNIFVVVIDKLVGSGESSTPQVHHVPSDDIDAVKVFLKVLGEPKDSDTIVRVYKTMRGGHLIEVDLEPKKYDDFLDSANYAMGKYDFSSDKKGNSSSFTLTWPQACAQAVQRKLRETFDSIIEWRIR